jgi:hypothetical protein
MRSANEYSECGNPLGFNFGTFGAIKPKLSASVNNQCGKWTVTAHDTGDVNTGIRYIEIVNYAKGSYVNAITPATNVRFPILADSVNKGEIVLPGTDKEYTFEVDPINPADPANATIEIYDNSGASLLVNLSKAPSTTSSASGGLTQPVANVNSFTYSQTKVGTSNCGSVVITNPQVTGAQDFNVNHIALGKDTAFKFQTQYADSLKIKPGSNMTITVCFTPHDTAIALDTITITGDCGNQFKYILQGTGVSGLISASDYTFAETAQGDKTCVTGTIKNTGTLPFTLKGGVFSDPTDFSFDAGFLAALPKTLNPGDSINPIVCFNPQDKDSHNATLMWTTDISPSLDSKMKGVSLLIGKGYNASVVWSPSSLTMALDTIQGQTEQTLRTYLANHGATKKIVVQSILLTSGDSADFRLAGFEYGLPITPFTLSAGDSAWVDVKFKPDLSRGYVKRSSYLTVNYTLEGSSSNQFDAAPLSGTFTGTQDAVISAPEGSNELRGFIEGTRLMMLLPSDIQNKFDCEVYDLLGRKIAGETNLDVIEGTIYAWMSVGKLPEGVYIVRITSAGKQWNCKVVNAE